MENTQNEHAPVVAEDGDIQVIYVGRCPSLSERSDLTYEVGQRVADGSLHLRIAGNSGGGMFCEDWGSAEHIDRLVIGESRLTSRTLCAVHRGRSINTGGFILAVLRHLGMVRIHSANSRHHEHVPTTTFEKVITAAIQASDKRARSAKSKASG